MTSNSGGGLHGIAWDDAGTFVVVGEDGALLVSTDEGDTWQPMESGTDETLSSVATDRRGVWVVGGAWGTIVRSTDGGDHSVILGSEPVSDSVTVSVTVSVTIDPDNLVAEARDGNNTLTASFVCAR